MKIVSLVGARPQFIKEAIVGSTVRQSKAWQHVLVHSGQHYDINMSDIFFQELGIPQPNYCLNIGGGSHAHMTASALVGMEDILKEEKPNALLVYGDTNTTLAGALAAAKMHIPVIHVESGIRMQPRSMPEEINRVLTDHISTVMCCCSELGRKNLFAEGLKNGIYVTGDIMYDLYLRMKTYFTPEKTCEKMAIFPDKFVFATIHRDYNVDSITSLRGVLEGLIAIQEEFNFVVLLPLHPRTRKRAEEFGLTLLLNQLHICDPVGYLEAMSLANAARFIISDSGGLQKESYYACKRCVVMMPDTGWRELIECGWNILCEPQRESIIRATQNILTRRIKPDNVYGNGCAAPAIINIIKNKI